MLVVNAKFIFVLGGPLAIRKIRRARGGVRKSSRRTYGARRTFGVEKPKTETKISEESASVSSGKQSLAGLPNVCIGLDR